ncbi:T9SS type A sorting domain-containing protein [Chryseobacterium sp. SNU WT5]|uniref:T9SS type A sorting domain-containing protein n=1 Tax=Chryseobacterium sp. SNU WT5 TaxID=2594269 RepID=UPI00117D31EB|nr:T9SS type A sorting domain-containing protein [Chryseobacterium sp. SNU WT5]QDP85027.1 T9SS type A sorting domain-containing protein [Chryseobacterium sp. SNU WT5]
MEKYLLLISCFFTQMLFAQTSIPAKAPNSYIYDIDFARLHGLGGIEIPVKKAYEMWSNYEYLKINGTASPIPEGIQSATMYWEDVPGLVQNVAIVESGDPAASNIKVSINNSKGKGNAVITFKVDGVIYWSWHIWVTDNPTEGVTYGQGFETDINNNPVSIQYMDRNLGALSNSFLGDQWQKSGGLMYQWGRKDPFPPLVYKDANFYEISGELGILKHKQIDAVHTIPVQIRPFNEIEKNMKLAVNNPLLYIINTENTGNWFSNQRFKIPGADPDYKTWDLWSDNAKGGNSNANSSNATLKKESRSYELKSELDPCPNGWRIPSYYGRVTQNNNLAFFGKRDWNNDDNNVNQRQLFPNTVNQSLNGIKVYPGIGMDFTSAQGGSRNLGILPVSGGYVYYPNSVAPNAPIGVTFQDNASNGGLWSATFSYDGARLFSMISDPFRTNTAVGLHAIYNNQTNPTKAGNAVRCMKDPNMAAIGNFATAYFANEKEDYRVGLEDPNSYILVNERNLAIPVSKAFSVYNQYLSDHEMLPSDRLVAKVLWTTNPNLIGKISISKDLQDPRNSIINIAAIQGQKGNAVISLHNGVADSPIYWTWHIWVAEDSPTAQPIVYTTESTIPTQFNFVNATASKLPSLTTVFMDRNLGAISKDISTGLANGMHYQWGRKDPMPSFPNGESIYRSAPSTKLPPQQISRSALISETKAKVRGANGVQYLEITSEDYQNEYTESYENYGSTNPIPQQKIEENLAYSVENPMIFFYQPNIGNLYNGGNHYANNLSEIRDWITDGRAQADNRWGHADQKSPFDPCPKGWRVPDVSFTNLYTGSKGNSPWYNGYKNDVYGKSGVIQDQWHNIADSYLGIVDGENGWKFENALYPIGEFPNDGMRGELGESEMTFDRSGLWLASMADLNTGFALSMQFEGNRMQTGTGAYPQAGMSVRCAKDEKRMLGSPDDTSDNNEQSNAKNRDIIVNPVNKELKILPNPFKEQFFIKNADTKTVELFDLSGKLVLQTAVQDGLVSAHGLVSGIYIVKVTMKDQTVITKKIIKH